MIAFLIMAIIQGLTEFLPVSSSGHLLFIQSLFNIKNINLSIDILLHSATLLVILIYFFKDLKNLTLNFFTHPFKFKDKDVFFVYMILLSLIPTGIIGLILNSEFFKNIFENRKILYFTWPITIILLFLSDKINKTKITITTLTPICALIIGLAQGIAILPGISRSGITIITGMFLGLNREESFKVSFLIGLPAMFGALVLDIHNIQKLTISPASISLILLTTFIFGFIGLLLLKKYLKNKKFKFFAYYLLILCIANFLIR